MSNLKKIPLNQVRSGNKINQHEHCDEANARRSKLVDETGSAINNGNRLPVDAIINVVPGGGSSEPLIENIVIGAADAGVEKSFTFPDGTLKAFIKVRKGKAQLQYTWTAGQSGTNFIEVGFGVREPLEAINLTGKTIYFQVSKNNQVVEIQHWT